MQLASAKDYEAKYQREANKVQKLQRDQETLRERIAEKSNQYRDQIDQTVEEKQAVVEQN